MIILCVLSPLCGSDVSDWLPYEPLNGLVGTRRRQQPNKGSRRRSTTPAEGFALADERGLQAEDEERAASKAGWAPELQEDLLASAVPTPATAAL